MRKLAVYCIGLMCLCGTAAMTAAEPVVSLQVEGSPEVPFDNFDEAWTAAMNQSGVTIKLLADLERTETIIYRPTVDNARHTLDLNNHTITENTTPRVLYVYKSDAKLTITDSSVEGEGCLYKKQSSDENSIVSVMVGRGTLEMQGGKLYCENTIDDGEWHPAIALYSQHYDDAVILVTGGTMEAVSTCASQGISSSSPTTVSGGLIKATTTKYTNARAYCQAANAGTISGGTFEARTIGTATVSIGVSAEGSLDTITGNTHNAELNITGGTFLAESDNNNVRGVYASAVTREVNGEIKSYHGILNVSGGDFTVRCSSPEATQLFAGLANGVRLFDNATPHHIINEVKGVLNISGGNFLVDTRDADGHYVDNGDNIDILRSWGTLNVTGGNFTIYQHNNAVGVGVYRNKTTISGNPVFHIHCASYARGIVANPWNHAGYCDANAANNMAEAEVSGGTFVVECDSAVGNSIAVWAYGGLSTASASGDAGYAMNAKITVTGGEFSAIHPLQNNVRTIRQEKARTGAYGTAVAQVIIKDGKFKALIGTETENMPTGQNIDNQEDLTSLTGGYFMNYNQLALHAAYDHTFRELTIDEPEYAEGFRYQVVPTSERVAKVTVNNEAKEFAMLQGAIQYARRQPGRSVVTLLDNAIFYGPYSLVPTVDENDIQLDLNGHTISSITATDRFFIIDKADMHFTLTDKSAAKGGIWQMTADNENSAYGLLCSKGNMIVAGGEINMTHAGGKTTIAMVTQSADANMTISNGQITADRALLFNAGTITVNGGKFNTPINISGTAAGTMNLLGGYYISDGQLADYCTFPYEVLPTSDADKARVGGIYAYKVSDEHSERGIALDIIDYQPTALTVNMNGYTSDETPSTGWELEASENVYHLDDCEANRTLHVTLSELVEADTNMRITVRSQSGAIETSRFYKMPHIFDGDATLAEGDYSASTLYVRSGTLTIDQEVTVAKVIVCPGAQIDATDGLLMTDTLVLRATPWMTATVSGNIEAGKTFFTRIGPDGSAQYPANRYYPLSLPTGYSSPLVDVRLSNGTTPAYGVSWGVKRLVGEEEQMLTIDDVLESVEKYELFSSRHYYREYYFPLAPSTTDIPSLTDNSSKARKVLVDGQLLIVTGDGVYDVMGKRR